MTVGQQLKNRTAQGDTFLIATIESGAVDISSHV
jgi:hypothetical protein